MSVKLGDVEVAGLQDVSGKADTNLSNLTATGKANISSQGTYNSSATYSSGTVGAAISGKADTDLSNVSAGIDFVVESQLPTAENNYTWYRKYKSGWVEQGGIKDVGTTNNPSTVSLPVTMADTNYFCTIQLTNSTTGAGATAYVQDVAVYNFTTTSFDINRGYNGPKRWMVCGMAAN